MSRLSTADSMLRLLSTPTPIHQQLETSCMDVHRICMKLVSRSIELEVHPGMPQQPEFLSLLLACAQVAQSSATLSRLRSDYLLQILKACNDVCRACAAGCLQARHLEEAAACRSACLLCADACQNFLRNFAVA